jgi:hypothetical protein
MLYFVRMHMMMLNVIAAVTLSILTGEPLAGVNRNTLCCNVAVSIHFDCAIQ